MPMPMSSWWNATMTVYAVTKTKDASGSWTEENIAIHSNVPCRRRRLTGRERMNYVGRLGKEVTERVYCDVLTTTLTPQTHYLDIGGVELDIVLVDNPHDDGEFLQIDCMERV